MLRINNHWKGMLTSKNVEQIADLFNKLFGRKRMMYIRAFPDLVHASPVKVFDTKVDVYPVKLVRRVGGERINPVTFESNAKGAWLHIQTTEYLVMYESKLTDVVAEHDYTHQNPYIAFDGDRCTVKYRTPCGDQVVDVFIMESQ